MVKIFAVLLMAGFSTRFGGKTNKQLCLLKNKPIFSYSIDTFSKSKNIEKLFVVVNKSNKEEIEKYINENKINATIILGGKTRQESVESALDKIKAQKEDIIIIHDGARPLVNEKIINEVIKAAHKCGASTTYLEATDTIAKIGKGNFVNTFEKRDEIALIQTPQAFKLDLLNKAHQKGKNSNATDDCSLIISMGEQIKLVKGDKMLHKITTKEDIKFLEGLM